VIQLHMDLNPDGKKVREIDTHKEKLREWLEKGESINPLSALSMWGCFRLAARVHDLRSEGMEILTTKGDNGEAVYSLKERVIR